MTKGQILAQVARAWDIAQRLDLGWHRNDKVVYPVNLPGIVRKKTYLEEWRTYTQVYSFDMRMKDWSLFQFKSSAEGGPSFCFYECPLAIVPYEEFVRDIVGAPPDPSEDLLWSEYEEYVWSAPLKSHVTPLRWDYSPDAYREGVHPAGHVHVGHETEIRLHTRRLLKPVSFLLLVIRQLYPKQWQTLMDWPDATQICRAVRIDLAVIDKAYSHPRDAWQMCLE